MPGRRRCSKLMLRWLINVRYVCDSCAEGRRDLLAAFTAATITIKTSRVLCKTRFDRVFRFASQSSKPLFEAI